MPADDAPAGPGPATGYAQRYGAAWAEVYDEVHATLDTGAAVEALVALAGGGPVAEFGAGTGRLALPLARRGLPVHAVEASPAMLARLRAKPGADAVTLRLADLTTVRLDERFALVLLAFNTLLALPTQDDQVRALANAAAHLRHGGRVVVEAAVPRPWDQAQADGAQVVLERHDPVAQRLDAVHGCLVAGRMRFLPVSVRYAWPTEIDLMARLAGLALEGRWGGWQGEPFTAASPRHVSVYRAG